MRGMLHKMEETCNVIQREAEKPINVDWSPIYVEFSQKIAPNLASTITESQTQTMQRFEDLMKAQVSDAFEKVNMLSESRGAREIEDKAEIMRLLREVGMAQKVVADSEQTTRHSQEQIMGQLSEQHQSTQFVVMNELQGVRHAIEESQSSISGLEPLLESQLEKQFAPIRVNGSDQREQIKDLIHTVRVDISDLLYEVGSIQKAMKLPHLADRREITRSTATVLCNAEAYRERDFATQTDTEETVDVSSQTDPVIAQPGEAKKKEC
jgi:hypothetical protein